ncbi:hypothetical protein C7999DRAFT_18376, partial [Corynascus novoguineensis]
MAKSQAEFPVAEEFSVTRITDHVWFLRRLRALFAHVESPGVLAAAYPAPPPGDEVSSEKTWRQWRVQAFLMNAEVRYSFYLRLLRKWVLKSKPDKSNISNSNSNSNINDGNGKGDGWADEWPLPPWDVAIMFYIHMLSPKRFQKDMKVEYRELWDVSISFPLARLKQHPCNDEASQHKWEAAFPEIPYQLFDFKSDGETPYLSTSIRRALDVRGYKCASANCAGMTRRNKSQIIPMAEWSAYRLAKRRPPSCPSCKTAFMSSQAAKNSEFARCCEAVFGQHVLGLWDAPLRQTAFVKRILAETATATALDPAWVGAHQARYFKFLGLIQRHPSTTFVPTIDIDLVWHTHQLSPAAYDAYCRAHVGRPVNHDDTIAAPGRSTALFDTKHLWALDYQELFLDPDPEGKMAAVRTAMANAVAALAARRAEMEDQLAEFERENNTEMLRAKATRTMQRERVEANRQTALGREEQQLLSELARARRARDGVRASIRIRFGTARLWQWYSPGRRAERACREAAVAEVEENLRAKRDEMRAQASVAAEAHTKSEKATRQYKGALGERARLKAKLEASVANAEAAVRCQSVDHADQLRGTPLGKRMLSVVPSEAQVMLAPIAGDWEPERRRERMNPVKSWGTRTSSYHSWFWRPDREGGGSFGSLAFGSDTTGGGRGGGCDGGGGGG